MGLFDGSGDGKFDPSNWVDHNIYEDVMNDDDDYNYNVNYDDDDDDDYDYDYDNEYDAGYNDEPVDEADDEYLDDDIDDTDSLSADDEDDETLDFELYEGSPFVVSVDKKSLTDKGTSVYYTKILLDKFPELNSEYRLIDWSPKIIEDKAKNNNYDDALKYYQCLIDNADFEYLWTRDETFTRNITYELIFLLINNAKEDNKQKLADFLVKNTKLFDFCFKKYKWDGYRPEWNLKDYLRFFEDVNNLEHVKLAYNTFLEYQKQCYTIDNLEYLWSGFWGLDFKKDKYREVRNEDFYNFYKDVLIQLGDKGKAGLKLLEWTMTEGVARNRAQGDEYF